MFFIAHRGNVWGPKPNNENKVGYLEYAIDYGYDVEIDIWYLDNQFWLGHDTAQITLDVHWIAKYKDKLWIHCKNIAALHKISDFFIDKANYFFHNIDDVTLTSHRWLWTYPGKELTKNSIAVLPENHLSWNFRDAAGICSDYIGAYKCQF